MKFLLFFYKDSNESMTLSISTWDYHDYYETEFEWDMDNHTELTKVQL